MSREQWSQWLLALAQDFEMQGYDYRNIARHLGRLRSVAISFDERGLGPGSLGHPRAFEKYYEEYSADYYQLYGRRPGKASLSQVRSAFNHLVAFARRSGRLPALVVPELPPYVADFLEFCHVHRGLSKGSLSLYEKILLELATFLGERGQNELTGIPLDLLDEFTSEYAQGKARTTVGGGLSGLRSFLRWLFLVGREPEDRSGLILGPRLYREMRLPKHLSDSQFEEFLTKVNQATVSGKQEWAVIMLISLLGLRIGEVTTLRLDDLDLQASRIHLRRPKTGACSVMPICKELKEALNTYLRVRPETHHREVFVTQRTPVRPYSCGSSLANRVRKHLSLVQGAPSCGPHALRHTLARRLRQGGAPLAIIRRVLGHVQSNSTGRYLRISTDELAEVADNYAEHL